MTTWLITVKPSYVVVLGLYKCWSILYNSLEDHKPLKGNTVGSRLTDMAYIAGFLDGDGSLMLQIKRRVDSVKGYRFMATICFYQDTRHEKHLFWIREVLGIGYISRRNDGMTELRINGFSSVSTILSELKPHVKFKSDQIKALIEACIVLNNRNLTKSQLRRVIDLIITVQNANYASVMKKSKEELLKLVNLTP